MRVLVVEDHRAPVLALAHSLEAENFAVDVAFDAAAADVKARSLPYDVIVLDLMLPRLDGLDLLQRWRGDGLTTHVLVLTRPDDHDPVRWLDSGADDCLCRPFRLEELIARLRALIRRQYLVKDPLIRIHDLEIHTPTRVVKRGGREIPLTPREYALLEFLAFHRGKVVSRAVIWEHLHGEQSHSGSNVVDVYIRYLRNKLDRGFDLPLILTRWGAGYQLRDDG
jgi:DNA-binding response OmpR family regulator